MKTDQKSNMAHRPYRIYETLTPSWDYDLHIHTNWSEDNLDGPTADQWLKIGERYKVHLGFADHFEIGNLNGQNRKNGAKKSWKLNLETIDAYLDQFDEIKQENKHFSLGLEVSYHPDYSDELFVFLDDYYSQFDYIIGSVHELEIEQTVTHKDFLVQFKRYYPNMEEWMNIYFERVKNLIKLRRFDVVAHPDVIFRFQSYESLPQQIKSQYREKILELGWLCEKNKTFLEVNLSGLRYSWKNSLPREDILTQLRMEEIPMVVGSDSHQLADFTSIVSKIRYFNNLLNKNWKFTHTFDPKLFSA